MSEKKSNAEYVKAYTQDIQVIKLKVPAANEELGVPDYQKMLRDKAKEEGYILTKGSFKGQGNINAYLLDLIERELGITMIKTMSEVKAKRQQDSDDMDTTKKE